MFTNAKKSRKKRTVSENDHDLLWKCSELLLFWMRRAPLLFLCAFGCAMTSWLWLTSTSQKDSISALVRVIVSFIFFFSVVHARAATMRMIKQIVWPVELIQRQTHSFVFFFFCFSSFSYIKLVAVFVFDASKPIKLELVRVSFEPCLYASSHYQNALKSTFGGYMKCPTIRILARVFSLFKRMIRHRYRRSLNACYNSLLMKYNCDGTKYKHSTNKQQLFCYQICLASICF